MAEPVTSIRTIGPALGSAFEKAGITTAEELRALGTDAAYARLLAAGHRPHFIGYYVIEMGLQGRKWNACKGEEKAALRRRFDSLVAGADPFETRMEDMLDRLGVRD